MQDLSSVGWSASLFFPSFTLERKDSIVREERLLEPRVRHIEGSGNLVSKMNRITNFELL
jgi:hypothetical protein